MLVTGDPTVKSVTPSRQPFKPAQPPRLSSRYNPAMGTKTASSRQVVLASTSPYRAALLGRLGLAFDQVPPGVDERRHTGESPADYVQRLANAKARAGADAAASNGLTIGSDQVCVNGEQVVGKPGDAAGACEQLRRASGRRLTFLTAVAVHDGVQDETEAALCRDEVVFRELDEPTIQRYVSADQPFDCAGAFKAEGLGITLFSAVHSSDPTALVGLPLIALADLLRRRGVALP